MSFKGIDDRDLREVLEALVTKLARHAQADRRALRSLFEARPDRGPSWYHYDLSPDGQRFLVNTLREETPAAPITLVVNWRAALKK